MNTGKTTHNRVDSSQTGDGGVQKQKRSEKRKTDARSATTNKQKNYNCKSRWLTKVCSNLVGIKMMLNRKQEETGWNKHVAVEIKRLHWEWVNVNGREILPCLSCLTVFIIYNHYNAPKLLHSTKDYGHQSCFEQFGTLLIKWNH